MLARGAGYGLSGRVVMQRCERGYVPMLFPSSVSTQTEMCDWSVKRGDEATSRGASQTVSPTLCHNLSAILESEHMMSMCELELPAAAVRC
jgi:hypothetical protein